MPDRDRTCNPQLRRLVLYPIELRAPSRAYPKIIGLKLVGVERFELPTSWSQTRRATRLRYTPERAIIYLSADKRSILQPVCLKRQIKEMVSTIISGFQSVLQEGLVETEAAELRG